MVVAAACQECARTGAGLRRTFANAAIAVAIALTLHACGGGGSSPTSPTPNPDAGRGASVSATLAVTAANGASGTYEYTEQLRLSESGGATATITGVVFTLFSGGFTYGETRSYGTDFWSGDNNVLAANGTLTSKRLTLTDDSPTSFVDRIEARITFSDASSSSRTVTVSEAVPAIPGPPPNTKFTLTGTVKDASSGSTVRDVKIEVRDGSNAGRNTKTDRNGKYSLADLKAGSFTVRASKTDYSSSELAVINSSPVLNFTLRKSGGGGGGGGGDDDGDDGGGGGGGGGSSLTCNGASVPSVVDCLNDQGRKAPTALC